MSRSLNATSWSARAVFVLEAGEELTRLAADLAHHFREPERGEK
ncbi:DUF6228 family protein [Actinoplanes sp. NBRC 101535]|nr:DUF6228 family protein [Actinoplanes sp. NBRC 101535]